MKKTLLSIIIFFATFFAASSQVNTERVMIIGRNALYFEDYVLAIQYFNQVILAKPYLADPYYYRGVSKFMLDDYKGAEEDATACLDRNPYYLAAYQLRGAARQNQEKYELAATDYKRSLEFYPEDRLTLVNMAIVNVEMKYFEVAEKFFDVLINRYPDYTPGYLARSQMYIDMEDTTKAMGDLNKAIEIDPYTSQSFSARGLLYLQQKEYNKALADFDEAIRIDPYFEGNYINRGLVKYNLNDLRGAMADYDRVIEMDENNLIARFNRGLLRAQVADRNRAIHDFDKVIELEPDNTIAYLNRAMLSNEIGDYESALKDMDVVLEEHPEFFTGYYMRSQLKRELNQLAGAERDYNTARSIELTTQRMSDSELKAKEESAKASKETRDEKDQDLEKFNLLVTTEEDKAEKSQYQRESRGKVQNMSANVELEPKFVITYYESDYDVRRPVYFSDVVERTNNDLKLYWMLKVTNNEAALNEVQIETHFNSIKDYSGRLEADPDNVSYIFGRGIDFMLVQDYENALKDMDRAIELKPDLLLAYFARATIRTKQIEYESYQSPDVPQPTTIDKDVNLRGDFSIKSIKYDSVLKEYNDIIALNPKFFYAYYNRAEIYFLEKDFRSAIVEYTKAIELEPQFAEAYFNRGISRLSIGETEQGLDDLRKAGELGIVQSYSIIKRMQ
ncbi:MAG: tetratricopeptide repeat protein [Fermentimonas sp.]|jgi:tetratricopeptide (TPR) repeat protein